MNTFLLFIILLIFIYEFMKRMNYLDNIDENTKNPTKEKFDNMVSINNMTYLPANFEQEFERDINIKSISKDLGVKRSINQVVAATDDTIPDNFFTPIDLKLFRNNMNRWVNKQRNWQESYTDLEPIIEQKKNIEKYITDTKNYDNLSIWYKLDLLNGIKKIPEPTPTSTLTQTPTPNNL